MTIMNRYRVLLLGLLVAIGLVLTPSAFARSHYSINIGGPGYAVGYNSGHHGSSYGFVGGGYYAPAYYAPSYYAPSYYYDTYPSYGYVVGGPGYYNNRYYRNDHYRGRDRHYDRRDHDRGYRHR
jgi:hypothetical protein